MKLILTLTSAVKLILTLTTNMADAKMVITIVMTVIVYITATILLLVGVSNANDYDDCSQLESPNCYMFTCRNRTDTCDEYAFRCDSKGKARCSFNPSIVVDTKSTDGICTAN